MSSIVLEGKVQSNENAVNLSGVWRFMKDQVSFLKFSFSKVSTEISKEFLNSVSFVPKSNDTENNIVIETTNLQFVTLPSIVDNVIGLYQGEFQITSAEGPQNITEEFFIFASYSKDSTINLAENDWWIDDYATLPGAPLFAMSAKKLFETILLTSNDSIIMNNQDMQTFYGFGKNQFGIFSVLMMINKKTGCFCLEKKYMLSKYPVGRRAKVPVVVVPPVPSSTDPTVTIAKRKRVESSKVRPITSEYYVSDYNDTVAEANLYNAPPVHVPELTSEDDDKSYVEGHFDVDSFEVYEGDVFNGIRHGLGICLRSDGTLYEGTWVNGKETGPGKLMFSDRKIIYSGDFLDGLFNGIGVYCFDNGDTYSGEWKESHRKFFYSFVFVEK